MSCAQRGGSHAGSCPGSGVTRGSSGRAARKSSSEPWAHNADGSAAEMCGNGIRVFARYLVEAGFATPGRMHIATRAGVKTVDAALTGDITVDMGPAELLDAGECTVTLDGASYDGVAVSV